MAIVLGLHGLQIYANKYWINHLLDFLSLESSSAQVTSPEWTEQLQQPLQFSKHSTSRPEVRNSIGAIPDKLSALSHLPDLQHHISETWAYRLARETESSAGQSFQGIHF
jgi:hypothetical protein